LSILLLSASVGAVILIGLSIGPVPISFLNLSATDKEILFNLRLPRVLSAFLVGGGGALPARSFRGCFAIPSPIAVLRVSSGASLGAAATIVFALTIS
jgi:iron complex transport system permease protein